MKPARERRARQRGMGSLLGFLGLLGACADGTRRESAEPERPDRAPQAMAPAPRPAAADMFQRVVVIGSSASAGFGIDRQLGTTVHLADVLDVGLEVEHGPIAIHATELFFMRPGQTGQAEVEAAIAVDPTLVIGLDFLFWYAYGLFPSVERRLEMLEEGLALLDRFECEVLTCELPDMRAAIGKMLLAAQVPEPEALERVNQRIRDWASSRPNVTLVPLASFVRRVMQGEAIELHGYRLGPEGPALLQPDQLHPTLHGLAALAILAIDALAGKHPGWPESIMEWHAEALAAGVKLRKKKTAPAGE